MNYKKISERLCLAALGLAVLFTILYLRHMALPVLADVEGISFLPFIKSCRPDIPTSTPTSTPTYTPSPTPTLTVTPTSTPTPTATPIPLPKDGVGFHHPYGTQGAELFSFYWGYDWHYDPNKFPGMQMASMVWSGSAVGLELTGDFFINGRKVVFGFNEPDLEFQADMSPEEAAVAWFALESYCPTCYFVSPAPSQMDVDWLRRFRLAFINLTGVEPRIDAVGAHCYATTGRCQDFLQEYRAVADDWGVPVWVTEFACLPMGQDDIPRQAQNLHELIAWMDNQDWIEYWAYFIMLSSGYEPWSFGTDMNPSLVNYETGELTTFGLVLSGQYVTTAAEFSIPEPLEPLEDILSRRRSQ